MNPNPQPSIPEAQADILQSIASLVRDAIIMIDNNGEIIFWNDASTRIFGYTREEVTGKNLHMLLVPDRFIPAYQKAFPMFRETGEGPAVGKTLELSAVRKGGEEFVIELSLTAVSIRGEWNAIGIIRDITDRKQADQLLAQSEEKYRKIFENVQDVFYQTDNVGTIIEISPSIERYSFYKREELIGTPAISLYVHPEQRLDLQKHLQQYGEVVDFEVLLKNRENRQVWTSVNAHFNRDKEGRVIGIEGSLRDITTRKEAEERVKRERILLRTLIDNLPDAIYIKDESAKKMVSNNADLNLMGYTSEEEVIGKTDLDLFPGETGKQGYSEDQQILKESTPILNFESTFKDNHGESHSHLTTKVPLRDETGKVIGLVGIGRDIAQQKEAERKLEQQAETLRELNATKDKLFSIIAHDLKNPFNAILGMTGLLLDDLEEMSQPEIREMLEAVANASRRAYALLENLLIWSQSQTGKISFTPVEIDLRESISLSMGLVEGQAGRKMISLDYLPGEPIKLKADKYMIETVIRNFVTNAIKFTPRGGSVSVFAGLKGDEAEVSVRDTGIGIPPESIGQIFNIENKTRTHGTERESGTGLGLMLCKEFIDLHGGRIRVESEVGNGSTFSFIIPVTPMGLTNHRAL